MRSIAQGDDKAAGLPRATVIVLNYNGIGYLEECFRSLEALNYPDDKLELILVDNASTDGSVEYVRTNFRQVRIIQNPENFGFCKANDIGAQEARGEYVAFLNNDMRVDPGWLTELVKPLMRDEAVVCAGSKILSWDGQTMDFGGTIMNFYGHAWQEGYGSVQLDEFDEDKPILASCGGAMAVDREVFLEVGGFDEDYFIYFEDVDLGYRLWALGYQVFFASKSIAYHAGHGYYGRVSDAPKRFLYERNALYTIIKNYEARHLRQVLPVALFLLLKRAYLASEMDGPSYRPGGALGRSSRSGTLASRRQKAWYTLRREGLLPLLRKGSAEVVRRLSNRSLVSTEYEAVPKQALSFLLAANEVLEDYPELLHKRERVQSLRRRSDEEIFRLLGLPFKVLYEHPEYKRAQASLSKAFGIDRIFGASQRGEEA